MPHFELEARAHWQVPLSSYLSRRQMAGILLVRSLLDIVIRVEAELFPAYQSGYER